jgi:hypothetical protein
MALGGGWRAGAVSSLGGVALFLVAFDSWGLRRRLPGFRSPRSLAARGSCAGAVVMLLMACGGPEPAASLAPVSTPVLESTPASSPSPSAAPKPAPTPAPTARPTAPPPPPPAENLCGAPSNPWHYNFCGGSLIYSPPSSFCYYFPCIASFWKSTNGYVDQCMDGTFSHSGGVQGACSHHGGERRPLYAG